MAEPGTWRPQLIVVGLGTNDFSTALKPGEQWLTPESLVAAYKSAYQGFLDKLRARYGHGPTIVVSVPGASRAVRRRGSAGRAGTR